MSRKNRDSVRSQIDKTREAEIRREERSTQKMDDLHLRQEGLSPKAQRRFRQRVKHYSDKLRRRQDRSMTRDWEDS